MNAILKLLCLAEVLQTGQEITELDQSGFATQSATVFAGNVGSFIVQATRTDIRLLKGIKQLCYVALDMGGGVKCVDVCSPYVIVLLMEGEIGLLKLVDESLVLSWPSLGNNTPVNHISAYTDTSGLFDVTSSLQFEGDGSEKEEEVPIAPPPVKRPHLSSSLLYDEDELLYGPVKTEVKEENASPMEASLAAEPEAPPPITPTHWCLLCKEDGALEIYSVPEFQFVFAVRNFSVAPWTLCDSGRVPFPSGTGESMGGGGGGVSGGPCNVEQVLCVGMGLNGKKPHIMAFINKELVIYEAFQYTSAIHPGHLKLRFSKVQHNVILQDKRVGKLAKHFQQQEFSFPPHLRKFSNIAGYSGVFVCGPYPHWIFMAARGHLSIHPMYIDGPVQSFAPFDNVNCPSGFLYFNKESELRISVLPTQLSYDSYWPVRKVPLKATPHFVGYHMESKVHVIIASTPQPVTVIPDPNGETEDALETVERDGRFVYSQEETYYLQLLSPTSWETIPHSKYEMEAHYHVTDMKVMRLRSQETLSGRKEYIVVGTMATFGEELSAKGKVLIFDVSVVIPEPGKPFSQYRLKNLYDQEQKWPVTGLECVNGLILTAMGQKIFMWQFKDNKDLLAVAFIDAETYIHTAQSIKGFILTGDVTRSIQLLHYNEDRRSLSLISQDPNPMEVFSTTFMIDGKALGFLVSDSDRNITLFQYQPENPASSGGANLVRCGDIHVGSLVNVFLNIRCKTSAGLGASREMKIALADKRQCTFFGTLDGGIGCLLPIPEKVYRRLSMLQVKMTQGMRHMAGLNPKAFRTFQTRHQYLHNAQRNILDGTLLYQYLSLTAKEKFDFSKQIGTTVAQIMEDLKEIDKVMSHF
ncbi:PREDICTED: cleavage and polyadenylation specificity factor subunit 1-like [Amphimedon queenslandica]|uniref:Cleavage/polyadenylation specificity factor A subunit C-terminal domain-containing protein n=1 Tax=Amphimedon queenslandica TaxID=400682 RepID=A0AAN0IW94_AMPQE|nr:PREDICTED: cleavage and polyadenylation specificity factor subunit 1-like [Amphimedon queenslandica]|eukprot:XP_019849049.1 PREDICTED: cleavage and polyadenylation specificity factor subunit 1-like [Amphimedon queenslandica]